jgi:hypothetical protein
MERGQKRNNEEESVVIKEGRRIKGKETGMNGSMGFSATGPSSWQHPLAFLPPS